MASLDYETKLDEALKHLAEGKPEDAVHSMPEASDLIKVAQRIEALKPAPEPHLGQGRERFLSEAKRLRAPARAGFSYWRLLPRPVLAFLTVFVLLVSGMIFITMQVSGGYSSITPNPTSSPTLTGTPTNAAFGRTDSIPVAPTASRQHAGVSRPEPAPTPNPSLGRQHSVRITILDWQQFNG